MHLYKCLKCLHLRSERFTHLPKSILFVSVAELPWSCCNVCLHFIVIINYY